MMLRAKEPLFLKWFAHYCIPLLQSGVNPRLSSMRESGGQSYTLAEAQSIAFQLEFPDMESVRTYEQGPLRDLLARFDRSFGPDAMTFTSIFELLPL